MKRVLTQWFSGKVKPAHVGVYETKVDSGTTFQHWDGSQWGYCAVSPAYALNGIGMKSHQQSARWRGLVNRPTDQGAGDL